MRILALFLLALAACDRGPEVPTAAENADLDHAADLLDDADNHLQAVDNRDLQQFNLTEPE
jgi:predicted small lipoprotein YifL